MPADNNIREFNLYELSLIRRLCGLPIETLRDYASIVNPGIPGRPIGAALATILAAVGRYDPAKASHSQNVDRLVRSLIDDGVLDNSAIDIRPWYAIVQQDCDEPVKMYATKQITTETQYAYGTLLEANNASWFHRKGENGRVE